ncbi:phage major capsid protein [Elizabethkingia anophelis]|uniref:phage major capsid protein n=1 Tax=Elizabethkingia anophelis TaxID=1117645 RepID=UPI0037870081
MQGVIEEKFNALNEEVKKSADASTAAVEEIKTANEAVKVQVTDLVDRSEKMQSHLDALDVKLQKKSGAFGSEKKHFNDVLAEAIQENEDNYQKFLRKENKSFSIELKAVGDISTGNVTGGNRYGQLMQTGIIENPKRKVHMSEILKGGSVGAGNTYTFMREKGNGEGAIAPVAEGAMKPQIDLDLEEANVNIETIAGWLIVTRKAMNNIPGFVSFLQSRLPEKFQRVLDSQILYGDGTTPNLKGILTAGNFVASTAAASEPLIEKIIDDISLLEDTYERSANGILLRPKDYYGFFKNKASGSGEYDLPQGVTIGIDGVLRILGVPAWASTAINTPDYLVGDFDMGAQLLTQEGMRLEFFEQDGTNVRENKVTVRIEGNYALPVYGPDYFIKGNSTVTPAV